MSAESVRLTALIVKIDAYLSGAMDAGSVAEFRIGENQVKNYSLEEIMKLRESLVKARDDEEIGSYHYVDHYDNGMGWTGNDDTVYVGDDD